MFLRANSSNSANLHFLLRECRLVHTLLRRRVPPLLEDPCRGCWFLQAVITFTVQSADSNPEHLLFALDQMLNYDLAQDRTHPFYIAFEEIQLNEVEREQPGDDILSFDAGGFGVYSACTLEEDERWRSYLDPTLLTDVVEGVIEGVGYFYILCVSHFMTIGGPERLLDRLNDSPPVSYVSAVMRLISGVAEAVDHDHMVQVCAQIAEDLPAFLLGLNDGMTAKDRMDMYSCFTYFVDLIHRFEPFFDGENMLQIRYQVSR